MKNEEVYLKAYASILEAPEGAGRLLPVLQWAQRPHQALGYSTSAEVFQGEQGDVDGESNQRRCSPGEEIESLAGEPGFSLNSALILSKNGFHLSSERYPFWSTRTRCRCASHRRPPEVFNGLGDDFPGNVSENVAPYFEHHELLSLCTYPI